mmetsp:Transcript_5237/g.7807  ORF Transcript_5237/g.7807 Transcript_5237/m.7807 type:complete len:93 (-) Transcript_5237:198-476(-)
MVMPYQNSQYTPKRTKIRFGQPSCTYLFEMKNIYYTHTYSNAIYSSFHLLHPRNRQAVIVFQGHVFIYKTTKTNEPTPFEILRLNVVLKSPP